MAVFEKKGRKLLASAELAVMFKETPLEYMLRRLNDEALPDDIRDTMAIAAAPYVHAKFAVQTLNVTHETRSVRTIEAEIIEHLRHVPALLEHVNGHDRRDLIGIPSVQAAD